MTQAALGAIVQVGYLVENLDDGIKSWADRLGVGPWTVFRNVTMNGTYRGEPTSVMIDVALGYQGDVQIELIEPTNAAASPYRDASGAVLTGIHHLAWLVDDLDAEAAKLTATGLEARFVAANEGARVIYFGAADAPGVLYELIESPVTREHIAHGIAATRAWDGKDPIMAEYDFAAGAA